MKILFYGFLVHFLWFEVSRAIRYMVNGSGVGPPIGFGHRPVEVVDKVEQAFSQRFDRRKVAPLQHATHDNAEPDLHLVEP